MKPIVFMAHEWERAMRALAYQRTQLEPNKRYTVEIKEHRNKRSLDANAYAWVLIDKIAAVTGIDKITAYREAIRDIGGNNYAVCVPNKTVEALCEVWASRGLGWITETIPSKLDDCTTVFLYYGSSSYDSAQMSRLIDNLVQDAKALDIETATPAELAAMTEQWSKYCKKGE